MPGGMRSKMCQAPLLLVLVSKTSEERGERIKNKCWKRCYMCHIKMHSKVNERGVCRGVSGKNVVQNEDKYGKTVT